MASIRRPLRSGGSESCGSADRPQRPEVDVLSLEDEAIIVAFRQHTLLPLDDCLYALQATIPHLTRSHLHRCLQRHGISRLPDVEDGKGIKRKFKTYPIGSSASTSPKYAPLWAGLPPQRYQIER